MPDDPATTTNCTFCGLLDASDGEILLHRDDATASFLDIRPLFPGHTLVVPTTHFGTIEDLTAIARDSLFAAAQRMAAAVRSACDADGTFVAMNNIVSQSVPHVHVHVVPRRFKDGLRGFFWPRIGYDDDAHRLRVAASIREAFSGG